MGQPKIKGKLAILAGQGALPHLLAQHCRAVGQDFCVTNLPGISYDWITDEQVIPTRIEQLGRLFKTLRAQGVRDVVFAGGAMRPRVQPWRCDLTMMRLLPRLVRALRGGDDGALRVLLAIFEEQGFAIHAAEEIIPDLLAQVGCATVAQPTAQDKKDAAVAANIVHQLGLADIGQSCVVANGLCLGVETIQGTDGLLDFVASTADSVRFEGARGLLYKGIKPTQDRRVDVPTIGVETLRQAHRAGLGGVVLQAGATYIVDYKETLATADELGLFLWVREDVRESSAGVGDAKT